MLLPATPGLVSLPLVTGGPHHSWLRVPGAVAATPGWGPLAAVVCGGVVAGVWCGWSLATPGGGSCVLLLATPGWVSLPVVVGVPPRSWLRVPGAVPRHCWLGSACGGGVRLPATPGWGPPDVQVCFVGGGVPCCVCLWCVWVCAVAVLCCVLRVCGVCVVGGVVSWCSGCVFRVCWCVWLRVCGVPVVCGLVSLPLASPGRGPWAWFPATPGWGPLVVVVGALGALLLGLGVCVCAVWPFVLVWVVWGGGRARCGCRACACVCLVGCVIPWLVLVIGRHEEQKQRSCRRVAELRGMRDA